MAYYRVLTHELAYLAHHDLESTKNIIIIIMITLIIVHHCQLYALYQGEIPSKSKQSLSSASQHKVQPLHSVHYNIIFYTFLHATCIGCTGV